MAQAAETTQMLVDSLNARFGRDNVEEWRINNFEILPGRRFDKVATSRGKEKTGRSVFMFVERETGDVYKAAGWAAPAKGARFHIDGQASIDELVNKADVRKDGSFPSFAFLYLK